jgi:hypothetical protein
VANSRAGATRSLTVCAPEPTSVAEAFGGLPVKTPSATPACNLHTRAAERHFKRTADASPADAATCDTTNVADEFGVPHPRPRSWTVVGPIPTLKRRRVVTLCPSPTSPSPG